MRSAPARTLAVDAVATALAGHDNLSGELNAADAPCITLCSFGVCRTGRVAGGEGG